VPLLTEALGRAGYRLGILGKVRHLKPVDRYRWDLSRRRERLGEGHDPAAYAREARAFFDAARGAGQPFFLMANTIDPHRPFHASTQEASKHGPEAAALVRPSRVYAPGEVRLPGFLPDLPDVRREVAQYCSSVRRCDDVVGAVLHELDASGLAPETLVVFLSDNGMAFPFSKGNCYLNSTRVPWIVRWPGRVPPGSVEAQAFVSGIDLAPTLLDALALPPLAGADGRSFLPLLEGREQAGRDVVFTVFHEDRLRNRFPMRCVQERRFGYIYNAWADGQTRFRSEGHKGLTLRALERAAGSDPELAKRLELLLHRKPEELYDFAADPDARRDLADDPAHADTRALLRERLLAWMRQTGDPLEARYRAFLAEAAA
jgi:N-sulfoglucosamine sulfohydrolase